MRWLVVIGWLAVAAGVVGYVVALRRSRQNDDVVHGLLEWMALGWIGVALLIATVLA